MDEYTQQDVEQLVDELEKEPSVKRQRVWEVDFLRGFLILFVIWDHFMWDVSFMWDVHAPGGNGYNTALFRWLFEVSEAYYGGSLRKATHDAFVTLFVFLSGVSCSFSRNNLKRGIKMAIFAALLTSVTYAASQIFSVRLTIRFNVIHVVALSVLLWSGIDFIRSKCVKAWQKNLFGAVTVCVIALCLFVGANYKLNPVDSTNELWYWLLPHTSSPSFNAFTGGDYLPFLPDFAWFLMGGFLGGFVYKQKKTLFPSVNSKWVEPICFIGRYSLWVYFGSQVAMYGLIYLLHVILPVL